MIRFLAGYLLLTADVALMARIYLSAHSTPAEDGGTERLETTSSDA